MREERRQLHQLAHELGEYRSTQNHEQPARAQSPRKCKSRQQLLPIDDRYADKIGMRRLDRGKQLGLPIILEQIAVTVGGHGDQVGKTLLVDPIDVVLDRPKAVPDRAVGRKAGEADSVKQLVPRGLKPVNVVEILWITQDGESTRYLLNQRFAATNQAGQRAGINAGRRPQLQLLHVASDRIRAQQRKQAANIGVDQPRRNPGAAQHGSQIRKRQVRSSWVGRRWKDQRYLHMAHRYPFGGTASMT